MARRRRAELVRNGPDRAVDGVHQPVVSRVSKPMALTHWLISVRYFIVASIPTVGMTNAAPVPRLLNITERRCGGINSMRAKIASRFWRLP